MRIEDTATGRMLLARGEARWFRRTITTVLEATGRDVPSEIFDRLACETDLARLETILDAARALCSEAEVSTIFDPMRCEDTATGRMLIARAEARGEAGAKALGEALGLRAGIIAILAVKGREVPPDLAQRLNRETDLSRVRAILDATAALRPEADVNTIFEVG
jgi:hypothetical protein